MPRRQQSFSNVPSLHVQVLYPLLRGSLCSHRYACGWCAFITPAATVDHYPLAVPCPHDSSATHAMRTNSKARPLVQQPTPTGSVMTT